MSRKEWTDKQKRYFGAIRQKVFESPPYELQALIEREEGFHKAEVEREDLLDLDGWEYHTDDDGNWTYD